MSTLQPSVLEVLTDDEGDDKGECEKNRDSDAGSGGNDDQLDNPKNITYASILQMIAVFRMRILNISHTLQMVQKEKV